MPLRDLAPKDHHAREYFARYDETFGPNEHVPAHIYFKGLDFAEPEMQARMLQAYDMVLQSSIVSEAQSPDINWLEAFVGFARSIDEDAVEHINSYVVVQKERFYQLLEHFTSVDLLGGFWRHDFWMDNDGLGAARMMVMNNPSGGDKSH